MNNPRASNLTDRETDQVDDSKVKELHAWMMTALLEDEKHIREVSEKVRDDKGCAVIDKQVLGAQII